MFHSGQWVVSRRMDQTRDAGAFIVVEALIGKTTASRWTEGVLSPDLGGHVLLGTGEDILAVAGGIDALEDLKIEDWKLSSLGWDFLLSGIDRLSLVRYSSKLEISLTIADKDWLTDCWLTTKYQVEKSEACKVIRSFAFIVCDQ